ncbi:MAG TPA: hypothetical protein VIK91_08385 [Nannocystis sp.]
MVRRERNGRVIYEFGLPVVRIVMGVMVLLALAVAVAAGNMWIFVACGAVPLVIYGVNEHLEIDPQRTHLSVHRVWSIWPAVPVIRFGIARAAMCSDLMGVTVMHEIFRDRHGRTEVWCVNLVLRADGRFAHGIGGTGPLMLRGFRKKEQAEAFAARIAEEFKLPVLKPE